MRFPLIPNGRYDVFPPKTLALGRGLHLVEVLGDGTFVAIWKPGYVGPNDFAVHHVADDRQTIIETVSHVSILCEFANALASDRDGCVRFARTAFGVFGGAEPPSTVTAPATTRPGEYILKALKWIWAQEDVNHPIPRYQGRKMAGYRLQEVLDGVELREVLRRAEAKGRRPPPLSRVDYARVDQALMGHDW